MTQKFTLFSQEIEDFVLELKIDEEATFLQLHQLILEACGYKDTQNHSFLICDEDWRVKEHIRQNESGSYNSEEDIYLMRNTSLREFLEEEGQRLAYIFDLEGKRFFLMELTENIFGKPQDSPMVSRRHGKAPLQSLYLEQEAEKVAFSFPVSTLLNYYESTNELLKLTQGNPNYNLLVAQLCVNLRNK